MIAALGLENCSRGLFIDGGSDDGSVVEAFLSGKFHNCALHSPTRLYAKAYHSRSRAEQQALMAPLKSPRQWCIRSFEASPAQLPALRTKEARLRAGGADVRFVDGQLSNATSDAAPRRVVTYGPSMTSATTFEWAKIHSVGPAQAAIATISGASYDLRAILRAALARSPEMPIAVRLDVEGEEFAILDALSRDEELLCSVSYLFVEFHNMHVNLPDYGFDAGLQDTIKRRIYAAMNEKPGCRLQIFWRSLWASCGDSQRFEWRNEVKSRVPAGR